MFLSYLLKNHPQTQRYMDQKDSEGFKPMNYACLCGNLDAVEALLNNGAAVDISEEFNPISSTQRLALCPEERAVPFERGNFT